MSLHCTLKAYYRVHIQEPAMASQAQITANRRNALKSTGPTTARGKASVGRNPLRHGLTSERIVCFDETDADFAAFASGLRAALEPADPIEEQLAQRIALGAWRLRRAYRVEAEMFDAFLRTQPQVHDTGIATVFDRAPMPMAALSRYETALDRGVQRAYAMLERRQAQRRGEPIPPPLAVEIELGGLEAREAAAPDPAAAPENYETKPIFLVESEAGGDRAEPAAPIDGDAEPDR
jgi:hypothetical protein